MVDKMVSRPNDPYSNAAKPFLSCSGCPWRDSIWRHGKLCAKTTKRTGAAYLRRPARRRCPRGRRGNRGLIREGEKPNIQDANSRTPLHVAAFLRQHAAARALLRLGANANALDAQRYDILTIAAVNDDLEMVNIALEGGANARAITSLYNDTALIAAAHRGHVEIVRALIAAKAPLNHVNDLGRTALLEAVVLGNGGAKHTATVEALVKAGADVTLPDRHGTTALQHARTRGYSQIARILEQAGAH
jgi:uncharacterized protein